MASYIKIPSGIEALLEVINSQTDTWKIALSNTSPASLTSFTPGTDDLSTGNGYTAGGNTATVVSSSQTDGVFKLVLSSPTAWTASGGDIGPFRYSILWNSTNSRPVAYWDYGSSITLTGVNGDSFEVILDQVNGVFTVS